MNQKLDELTYRQGYYLAVAVHIQQHGEGTTAVDLLKEYGEINMRGIDPHDQKILASTAKEVRRLKNLTNGGTGK